MEMSLDTALSRLKAVTLRALGAWRKLRKSRQTSRGRGKESFHRVHSQSVGLDSHQLKDLFRTWSKENIKADGYSSWWGKTCVGTQLLISEALVISGIIWPQLLVWRWYQLLNLWAGPRVCQIFTTVLACTLDIMRSTIIVGKQPDEDVVFGTWSWNSWSSTLNLELE